MSEDDLLALLGPPRSVPRSLVSDEPPLPRRHSEPRPVNSAPPLKTTSHAGQTASHDEAKVKEPGGQPGSSLVHRRRVCPKCCEIVSFAHRDCPNCRTSLSGWSFPLPEESKNDEGSRSACHYLGLRKHAGILIVRFGEHSILDEACVKRFGDELFHVAERNDCHNLLLNFTGVVGLSSAMLGIMLMLRKKISQKHGKLKLCLVGPEIMDIFHATKLGQLFEILGNEQQALKAFG
jgi:anti-anti-sigma factor